MKITNISILKSENETNPANLVSTDFGKTEFVLHNHLVCCYGLFEVDYF